MKRLFLLALLALGVSACAHKTGTINNESRVSSENVFYSPDFDKHPEIEFKRNGEALKQSIATIWYADNTSLGLGKRLDKNGPVRFIGIALSSVSMLDEPKRSQAVDDIFRSIINHVSNLNEFAYVIIKYEMRSDHGNVVRSEKKFELN